MATQAKSAECPKDPRRQFGNRGESLATVYLLAQGFNILERNWSCRLGEVDVICERAGVTHFVEVKTRKTLEYGRPEEAITPTKLRYLRRAVEWYLQSSKTPPRDYQVDALATVGLLAVRVELPETAVARPK